jgi:NAD(P)-dependent dehydrogenase (short-subunit alcohol dehydrogenase family)
MTKRFENKVVVITGGSEGIGLATAKHFAAEGAHVYIMGRRQAQLEDAVDEIGGDAVGVQGDVADLGDLDRFYERVHRDHGKIDVVFANAGINENVPLEALEEAHFDRLFAVNVKGVVFAVQKALRLMTTGGAIVLTGSIASSKGFPGQPIYNASKAAVRSLARSWTSDLKTQGIRVNVVSPGPIETPLTRSYIDANPGAEERMVQDIPLGRLGQPDEIAKAVLFLASAESSYIAGTEVFADGGIVAV